MNKLKMHTPDFTDQNIAKLAELFPGCVTESPDKDGNIKKSIDFDLLKQELSNHIVDGPQERYQLNWPGKRKALLTANAPIAKTLRPCREESVSFDATKNLFIEGDNLDALKLLQETYLGKVKMIYIDPPYNTGKDFIYSDDFAESADDFLKGSGQKDEEGNRLIVNTDSNGRFHSDWLTMMYSRLKLASNLLRDDGVIFVSIDDNEVFNLRKMMDEIFGENEFLVIFAWRTDGNFDNQAKFKKCHEYIIGFAKREATFKSPPVIDPNVPKTSKLYKSIVRNTIVKNGPKNPVSSVVLPVGFPCDVKEGRLAQRSDSWPHYSVDAIIENGKLANEVEVRSGWSSKDLLMSYILNKCEPVEDNKGQKTCFVISSTGAIEVIKERSCQQSHVVSSLVNLGGPQKAALEMQTLGVSFDDYPKPLALLKYFCRMVQGTNDIYLDFFAGSATTAHAVMQLNAEDGGDRHFIMVQLPELCHEQSKAYKFLESINMPTNIAEISKERIRCAGKRIKEENATTASELDIGFRVLKVDDSNMQDVFYAPDETKQDELFELKDNIKPDRTAEDLLFQVLLDWGVDLTLPISKEIIKVRKDEGGRMKDEKNDSSLSPDSSSFQEYEVFFVDGNALAACFAKAGEVTEEFCKVLAKREPMRVVFRDAGFKDDSTKINVEQIFKQMSPHTEVKTI